MSIEIKFRLRDEKDNIVGYEKWYKGAFNLEHSKDYYVVNPGWLYSNDGVSWNEVYIQHRYKDQYTGLKDKNGKEIYDKDIIKTFNSIDVKGNLSGDSSLYIVYWNNKAAGFYIRQIADKFFSDNYKGFPLRAKELNGISLYEKLGNFYGNPELLEE